jgi:hypothetical protein
VIGEGRLKLGNGIASDGTVTYRVLSPALLRRMIRPKRDPSVVGHWLAVGDTILAFKKQDTSETLK